MTETHVISNLRAYLRSTKADVIIVRTTYVHAGWYDVEIDAHCTGFSVSRFINPEYEARHEFAECYQFLRRTK